MDPQERGADSTGAGDDSDAGDEGAPAYGCDGGSGHADDQEGEAVDGAGRTGFLVIAVEDLNSAKRPHDPLDQVDRDHGDEEQDRAHMPDGAEQDGGDSGHEDRDHRGLLCVRRLCQEHVEERRGEGHQCSRRVQDGVLQIAHAEVFIIDIGTYADVGPQRNGEDHGPSDEAKVFRITCDVKGLDRCLQHIVDLPLFFRPGLCRYEEWDEGQQDRSRFKKKDPSPGKILDQKCADGGREQRTDDSRCLSQRGDQLECPAFEAVSDDGRRYGQRESPAEAGQSAHDGQEPDALGKTGCQERHARQNQSDDHDGVAPVLVADGPADEGTDGAREQIAVQADHVRVLEAMLALLDQCPSCMLNCHRAHDSALDTALRRHTTLNRHTVHCRNRSAVLLFL